MRSNQSVVYQRWLNSCVFVFIWKITPAGCRVGGFSFLLEPEQIIWGRYCFLLHPTDNMEGESICEVDSGDGLGGRDTCHLFLFSSQMADYRNPLWKWTLEFTKSKCDKGVTVHWLYFVPLQAVNKNFSKQLSLRGSGTYRQSMLWVLFFSLRCPRDNTNPKYLQ